MIIPVGDIRVHVKEHGGEGEPILFLHYGTGHAGVWDAVVRELGPGYRALAMDLRGHGQSDKPRTGYDYPSLVSDVLGVLDALGVERAHLVGSSMGAETAVALAAHAPERVLTLTLEGLVQNPFGPYGSHDVPPEQVAAKKAELRVRRAAKPEMAADSAEGLVRLVAGWWDRTPEEYPAYAAALQGAMVQGEDGRWRLASPPYVADAYMETFWDARFDQFLAGVKCPVLLLPDEPSVSDPRGRASLEWFRSQPARCEVTEIPGALHAAVVIEQPEAVARAVTEFHALVWRGLADGPGQGG